MDVKKYLDTYALMEIYLGNKKFTDYMEDDFIICDITLAEFYHVLLKEYGEEEANIWFDKIKDYSLPVDKLILKDAIRFKYKHRKREISFFDAVGYIFSVKKGYYFVTGDKEFEKFRNVEFKKK